MYLVKTPRLVQTLMPGYTWRLPTAENVLYLTFDDGPIPEVTPWVLDSLRDYDARATFFCVGENVQRYPELFERVLADGHSVGNHTHNHLNGWHTDHAEYVRNVRRCARVVASPLFRPPYGRLLPRQRAFLERHFRIVMWDVLSGDFDPELSPERCLANVIENAVGGSITVFHDSRKAEARLRYALPRVLEHFAARGYRFEALPMARVQSKVYEMRNAEYGIRNF
jgi:peptidoglycan/xylan/chitin deacetylase (PgdA/CDA1 family)